MVPISELELFFYVKACTVCILVPILTLEPLGLEPRSDIDSDYRIGTVLYIHVTKKKTVLI